jgi:DNA modification methylase
VIFSRRILRNLDKVPVMVARGWTEDEKAAYLLADNRLAERATWDVTMLGEELARLAATGFDMPVIGFDESALRALIAPFGGAFASDPDTVIDPPISPVSRLGDVWHLGRHSVVCGDSTNAAMAKLAMGELKPALLVSDPPYGVKYDPSWRGRADGKKAGRSTGIVLNDDRADWRAAWAHFPGDVAYVWHAGLFGGVVADSLIASGFELRSQIIWTKPHFVLSRSDYHWAHETCFYAVRHGAKSHWASDRKQSTVWQFSNNGAIGSPEREKVWGHGTQKPVEAMRRPMEHNSAVGDTVFDPFLGTGTTIIAAEMMGRVCVGLELNPAYVDVIVTRWQEFTGLSAMHETGPDFGTISAARVQAPPAALTNTSDSSAKE